MNLCVIPARGGSKRIPRKNVRLFCGKPMLVWALEAASKSECFDEIIVSSDDEEILAIAEAYKGVTPLLRPAALADDYASTTSVVGHAIELQTDLGQKPSFICCLYPTAAFVSIDDLRTGLESIARNFSDFVVPVTTFEYPIQRALALNTSGFLEMVDSDQYGKRSQDLEPRLHDAGQFYWGTVNAWLSGKPILHSNSVPIIIPRYRCSDIDTMEDWYQAELLFTILRERGLFC